MTKELGANVILIGCSDMLCPCSALQNHLMVNSTTPSDVSLFAYLQPDGSWQHMHKTIFLEFCMDICQGHPWLTYSDTASISVAPWSFSLPESLQKLSQQPGGWTLLAFLLYWHRMEEILPMSTSQAYNKAHINKLAEIFKQFCVANNIPHDLINATNGKP